MSSIRVQAIRDGYYDDVFRKVGDDFVLSERSDEDGNTVSAVDQFSPIWMVAVDNNGKALARQPVVKGQRRTAKEAVRLADAAQGVKDGEQARIESVMAASTGLTQKVVDVSKAADPDQPGVSTKK